MRFLLIALSLASASAQSLTDRFFDEYYFPFNPTSATSAGIHAYDDKLEDYSKKGVDAHVAILKKFEAEFAKQPSGTPTENADRDLVLNNIRASLLDIETIRSWEKNPDLYSSGISGSKTSPTPGCCAVSGCCLVAVCVTSSLLRTF